MPDGADLRKRIQSTFSSAPLPRGLAAAEHRCEECDGIRKAFAGQAPFALPFALIERHFDSLPMLSPTAFHHFLPAYLAFAVEKPDSLVAEFVWFSLSPENLDDFYRERFDLFSEAERAVIREVVEFLIQEAGDGEISPEERERARRYWNAI